MITSTIHVLILVPVFFVMIKERSLRKGGLRPSDEFNEPETVAVSRQEARLVSASPFGAGAR